METDQNTNADTDTRKTKPREKKYKPKPKQKQRKAAAAIPSVEAFSVEDKDAEHGDDDNTKENKVKTKKKRKPPTRKPQQKQPPLPPPTIELIITNSKDNEETQKTKLKTTKAIENNQKIAPQHQDTTTPVVTSQTGTQHGEIENSSFTANRLVKKTKQHLVFLRELHNHGITADYYTVYRLMKQRPITTPKNTETETKPSSFALLPVLLRSRIEESVRRYTQLWLPFVVNTTAAAAAATPTKRTPKRAVQNDTAHTVDLIPPPDIAYVWHCHRLAPYTYLQYLEQEFFPVSSSSTTTTATEDTRRKWNFVDPVHPFVFQLAPSTNTYHATFNNATWGEKRWAFTRAAQYTRTLFTDMFPQESFFLPNEHNQQQPQNEVASEVTIVADKNTTTGVLSDGYDLIGSCVRQSTLLYQVSGSHYRDESFLREGVEKYRQFVQLTQHPQQPVLLLVPTYQIDLVWHTHILSSIEQYHTDIAAILKYSHSNTIHRRRSILLDHDDSYDDRTDGSVLNTSFERTRQLWYFVYGTEYIVDGGMYRGEPPREYYNSNWRPSSASSNTSTTVFTEDSTTVLTDTIEIPPHLTFIPAIKRGSLGLDQPALRYIDARSNPYTEGYIFGSGCTLYISLSFFLCFCFRS